MYTSKLAHMASLYAHRVVARRTARGYATHVPLSTEFRAPYAGHYAHKGLCYTCAAQHRVWCLVRRSLRPQGAMLHRTADARLL
jgi:hypothetical protein